MTKERNFKRIVRERMAQTGETYTQARDQLRPRAASIRRYARDQETTIEALERAFKEDLPVIAHHLSIGPERVTLSTAIRMIQEDQIQRFTVMLDGREIPL